MIIVKITDGLGNQLFQYACGKAVALRHKTSVHLDVSWYDTHDQRFTPRTFGLHTLAISAPLATEAESKRLKMPTYPFLIRSLYYRWQYAIPYYRRYFYKERSFQYDAHVWNTRKNVYLEGFWQSYRYFQHIRAVLLKEFEAQAPLYSAYEAYQAKIISQNSVCLHVRRGDYAQRDQNPEHELLTLSYYTEAISYLVAKVANPHFFIFSDDIAWVKEHLPLPKTVTFVEGNAATPENDLMLMKRCKYFIIANSTLSWWGAWLSVFPQKIVVAPKQWFAASSTKATVDLLPSDWIRL